MLPEHGTMSAPRAEPVVLRDRATVLTLAALLAVAAAAWIAVVSSSLEAGGASEMALATPADAAVFLLGWTVMMAAMMLPSALPMIALYGAIQRKASSDAGPGVPVALFTLVYVGVWGAAGVPVYLAMLLVRGMPAPVMAYGVAAVLVAAGVYQLSPLKQVCLRACRSPLGFLLGRWRAGRAGSLSLGAAHALYCLGCCWALMAVLVAAGAMGLPWVLLIAAVVAAEKLAPHGEWLARVAGIALLLLGVAVAVHPDLVTALRGAHGM
ncbi:MAG: DUF2182 domain-containing protein [Candidatus Rokubacteria bacterium]|nr:DUF2182 domain-containing protein [Candidatus Rokubacteria bacterium]